MSVSVGLVKKCPYCGASIPAGASKCSACGALMPDASPHGESSQTAPPQGAPADAQARAALNADTLRVLQTEGKIPAIKFLRQKTGLGLKEAKEYVEAVQQGRDPGPIRAMAARTGCATVVVIAVALVVVAVALRFLLA